LITAAVILAAAGVPAGVSLTSSPGPGTGEHLRPARTLAGSGFSVTGLAFSPDGTTLAIGDMLGETHLWNLATRHQAATLADYASSAPSGGLAFVSAVTFSPDGRTLATADLDHDTYLWNLTARRRTATRTDPEVLTVPDARNVQIYTVAFSPDGRTLATGDNLSQIDLWNVATGRHTATLTNPGAGVYGGVTALAFSPDGRTLAAGDDDGSTYLWSVATWHRTAVLNNGQSITSVAFSPGGRTLATGDRFGTIDLWDVATGRKTAVLHEPPGQTTAGVPSGMTVPSGVTAMAFSTGGVLAAGDNDGSTYLWAIASGHITATLADPGSGESGVRAVAFSPDGSTLATGDDNGSTYLWTTRGPGPAPSSSGTPRKKSM
jgi:WD40 repeat protein